MPRLSQARKEMLDVMMKDVIFKAASSVLQEYGPSGLTMDRVAKAANISRSSLYDYFRNKDEVFQYFAMRITEPTIQAIEKIVHGDLSAAKKLREVYRTALTSVGRHQAMFSMLALARKNSSKEVETYKKNVRFSGMALKLLAEVFEQGIAAGEFRRADPNLLARMFIGCGASLMDMELDKGTCDQAELVERHVQLHLELFLHGISTEDGKDAFD